MCDLTKYHCHFDGALKSRFFADKSHIRIHDKIIMKRVYGLFSTDLVEMGICFGSRNVKHWNYDWKHMAIAGFESVLGINAKASWNKYIITKQTSIIFYIIRIIKYVYLNVWRLGKGCGYGKLVLKEFSFFFVTGLTRIFMFSTTISDWNNTLLCFIRGYP